MLKRILFFSMVLFFSIAEIRATPWNTILKNADGDTVYFHAWAGSTQINDYIKWAGKELLKKYNVTLVHIKIDDVATVIQKINIEKRNGKTKNGFADLIWINGENFSFMKTQKLLHGPFTQRLPNFEAVDQNNPSFRQDFNQSVDNMESPWGVARLVFIYDVQRLDKPPQTMRELLAFTKKNPGTFAYPPPPNFHGTTFIKQALLELATDVAPLARPHTPALFDKITPPLWRYLDELHKHLWGKGEKFPRNISRMTQMLNDRQIDIMFTFNPNEARAAYLTGKLPKTVRTYVHKNGTIGNAHFLAIPFNSSAKDAGMVVANFFLSATAQARKADPTVWGDPTVLDISRLSANDKKQFKAIEFGKQALSPENPGITLSEPHSSWIEPLETAWKRRYFR